MHSLIADGWSVGVLSRELATYYSAAIRSLDPLAQLDPLSIEYGDYSAWQRQQAQTAEYQRQLDYWTSCIEASRPAELLRDRPRPVIPTGCAEVEQFKIDHALYDRLQQFCKEREVTLSVVMLSALAATSYRLTGVNDAV
ncbi:destruxin synthetase [Akanthomyces lecanii RCEF 1005]|uniref:Destruxin synthetase n=1 Tax=Akanthomyces lecanii RCEF 1005 TaxID=1081108 RepID=A0A168KX61_CORDF|nr:destruxin synthetase [Akanthomyces lecanii RCEF 1005]